MKTKFTTFLGLIFSALMFAQTTLVNYQFFNNLAADPGAIGSPDLTYHSNVGTPKIPIYDNSMLRTSNGGDYLELTINTTAISGLVLSFNGDFQALGLTGRWNVAIDSGLGYVNRGQLSLYSFLGIRVPGNISLNISNLDPSADNNPNLKIKITADSDAWFDWWNIRIDNLKLTSGSPNIRVYTGNNTDADTDGSVGVNNDIPHLSPASRAFDTDFGTLQTSGTALARIFRVRNYLGETGSMLDVSNITVMGANPGDFTVSPTSLLDIARSTSNTGTYKDFTISFLPLSDGVRTAEVYLYSNAAPSPYIFTVIGTGASCKIDASTYAQNTMAPGQHSLESNFSPSTDLVGGQADNNPVNSMSTVLYPNNGNLVLSNSVPAAWYVRNGTKEVEFGGASGLDISAQKNVSIEFNVAAFGTANNNNTGVNSNAYITLSVQKPDLSWSDEMTLRGSNAAGTYYKYAFGTNTVFASTYDGNNIVTQIDNRDVWGTQYRYRTFRIKLAASSGISDLKFKIKASTPSNTALWLIDDVRVVTSNSVFKTFTTGNMWSPSPPLDNEKAVIEGNYTNSGNPTICECEVVSGGSLTIPANTSVTVKGKMVNYGDGANVVVHDGANLIQIEGEAINAGDITSEKVFTFTDGLNPTNDRKQYNYVISPVVGQNLKTIYPGNPMVIYHSEGTNFFYNSDGSYIAGRGLAIKEPSKAAVSSGAVTGKFIGIPFNGAIKYPLAFTTTQTDPVNRGFNLVGNPYPSNIDIDKLYNDNSAKIEATFYFWDNRGNILYSQAGSGYTGDNYAKYNASSGTGTSIGIGLGTPRVPTKDVKVGTAFMVQAKSTANGGTLNFDNTMRSSDNSGSGFLGKTAANTERDRYWLSLQTPMEMQFMNAVVYFENGSKDYGPEDTDTFDASNDIYSVVNDHKLAIQGRDSFIDSDQIDVGLTLFQSGTHTISIFKKEGIFENGQNIYLKDKQTGIITNLSEGSYIFVASAGEVTGRFKIVYKPGGVLATDATVQESIIVYRDNRDFVVKAQTKEITTLEIYDAVGRMIRRLEPNDMLVRIDNATLVNGTYILKISQNSEITVKKVIK